MKVLCIDISNPKTPWCIVPEHMITEGEVYTVTGSYLDKKDGYEYYYLAERTMKPRCSYRANRFVPLSDKEEDTDAWVEKKKELLECTADAVSVH